MIWQKQYKKYSKNKYVCFRNKRIYRRNGTFFDTIEVSDISNPEDIEYYANHGYTIYKLVETPQLELDDIVRIGTEIKEQYGIKQIFLT